MQKSHFSCYRGSVVQKGENLTMNNTQHDTEFDADGKSRGPFARVELIYAPDLLRKAAAAAAGAEPAAHQPKPRRAIARKPEPAAASAHDSSLERHERKCVVCSHPDREIIEELFLHWHSPLGTALHYHVPVRSLFRHAHATGLYASRQGNLRAVLDRILDRADEATVTGDSIIRALRAYTCLTGDNQWVEPPSRVIFSSAPHAAPAASASLVQSAANTLLPGTSDPSFAEPEADSLAVIFQQVVHSTRTGDADCASQSHLAGRSNGHP